MEEKNNGYISILSLLGAIILLIGIFTPTAITNYQGVLRLAILLGFFISAPGSGSAIPAVLIQPLAFLNSLFIFAIMFICCISNLSTSIKFRRGKIDFQKYRLISLNNAFIIIIDLILWILLATISFYLGGMNFWELFIIGPGIILPFITAILIFIEFLINRYKKVRKKREHKYNLPISTMGGFIPLLLTWEMMLIAETSPSTFIGLLSAYLLFVTLITFIGIFTVYSNLKIAYIILIIALIMGGGLLTLLSTILPIRKELKKSNN